MRRREVITLLGGAAAAWPLAARAQQPAVPVVGFLSGRSQEESAGDAAAFRQGLNEMGYVEGRNAALEYRWAEGRNERLPELAADLVRRGVVVIAAVGGNNSAFAARAATATIPIVFTSGADPVKVGLVASLNRPGGLVTGVSWFAAESVSKLLELLGKLVPNITRAVLLVNPYSPELAGQPETAQQAARSGRDGETVMTESPSSLTMLLFRHTRRRAFITALGGAAVWPLVAHAQQAPMPVIGILGGVAPEPYRRYVDAFFRGLQEAGFAEDHNVRVEQRWARGALDQLPMLLTELVRRNVAVIVTMGGTSVALAAKKMQTEIPLVFALGSDPVEDGLVAGLNRPGSNITGVTFFSNALVVKRLELLREVAPRSAVIAVLINPKNARAERDAEDVKIAARGIGQQISFVHASTAEALDASFDALARKDAGALLVTSDAFLTSRREQIVALAAAHALPSIYGQREFVAAGGLISYGADVADAHRQVGVYTGRILKGTKPGDLPVMQPTKFDLVLNLKTAKSLGLEVPPTLLARADEVIE